MCGRWELKVRVCVITHMSQNVPNDRVVARGLIGANAGGGEPRASLLGDGQSMRVKGSTQQALKGSSSIYLPRWILGRIFYKALQRSGEWWEVRSSKEIKAAENNNLSTHKSGWVNTGVLPSNINPELIEPDLTTNKTEPMINISVKCFCWLRSHNNWINMIMQSRLLRLSDYGTLIIVTVVSCTNTGIDIWGKQDPAIDLKHLSWQKPLILISAVIDRGGGGWGTGSPNQPARFKVSTTRGDYSFGLPKWVCRGDDINHRPPLVKK